MRRVKRGRFKNQVGLYPRAPRRRAENRNFLRTFREKNIISIYRIMDPCLNRNFSNYFSLARHSIFCNAYVYKSQRTDYELFMKENTIFYRLVSNILGTTYAEMSNLPSPFRGSIGISSENNRSFQTIFPLNKLPIVISFRQHNFI